MKLTPTEEAYFITYLTPLLDHPAIQRMGEFIQHGHTTCLEHSLTVTYYSYAFAIHFNLNVDCESLLRGALLHDFFLYDWHIKGSHNGLHGFRHPNISLKNAKKYFDLTPIECDIISHHMWPLTFSHPRSKEAYIVTLMDKWCSLRETFNKPIVLLPFEK